jgi:hypothetical protein
MTVTVTKTKKCLGSFFWGNKDKALAINFSGRCFMVMVFPKMRSTFRLCIRLIKIYF